MSTATRINAVDTAIAIVRDSLLSLQSLTFGQCVGELLRQHGTCTDKVFAQTLVASAWYSLVAAGVAAIVECDGFAILEIV